MGSTFFILNHNMHHKIKLTVLSSSRNVFCFFLITDIKILPLGVLHGKDSDLKTYLKIYGIESFLELKPDAQEILFWRAAVSMLNSDAIICLHRKYWFPKCYPMKHKTRNPRQDAEVCSSDNHPLSPILWQNELGLQLVSGHKRKLMQEKQSTFSGKVPKFLHHYFLRTKISLPDQQGWHTLCPTRNRVDKDFHQNFLPRLINTIKWLFTSFQAVYKKLTYSLGKNYAIVVIPRQKLYNKSRILVTSMTKKKKTHMMQMYLVT